MSRTAYYAVLDIFVKLYAMCRSKSDILELKNKNKFQNENDAFKK